MRVAPFDARDERNRDREPRAACPTSTSRDPSIASTRSRIPRSPAPSGRLVPRPSSATSSTARPLGASRHARIVARDAPECRTTFVTASRSASAITSSTPSRALSSSASIDASIVAPMRAVSSSVLRARQLVGERRAIAANRLAHFFERETRHALDVANLFHRARRIALGELRRQLRLEHDQRQRVPEHVVQIARDALALGDGGEMLDLCVRRVELRRSRALPAQSAEFTAPMSGVNTP